MERKKLIAARIKQHWTIEQAAEHLGVGVNTVSRWEKGQTNPFPYNVQRLCDVYEAAASELDLEDTSFVELRLTSEAIGVTMVANGTLAGMFEQNLTLRLVKLVLDWPYHNLRYYELQRKIMKETEHYSNNNQNAEHLLTRREALRLLALLPVGMSGLPSSDILLKRPVEETLAQYTASITACWYLTNGNDFSIVRYVLPQLLPTLESLVQQPSKYKKEVAYLASQGHQLAYIITSHQEDFKTALTHCKQALRYGQLAEDPNLQVAALVRQAVIFLHRKRPLQTLESYQQALPLIHRLSPLLRTRLYAGLAEVQGKLGQEQETLRSVALMYDAFPNNPETDATSLYIHFGRSSLFLHEGLALLDLHQPENASHALEKVDGLHPKMLVSERSRIDFLNQQAKAASMQGDLEKFSIYIDAAVTSALTLDSDLRYSEAWDVYKGIPQAWHHEPKVKALGTLFVK